ncbi:hypothetical protein HAX54_036765, partial [Datura stramonium]|nr:hypothetical protein [Datura stramonium]
RTRAAYLSILLIIITRLYVQVYSCHLILCGHIIMKRLLVSGPTVLQGLASVCSEGYSMLSSVDLLLGPHHSSSNGAFAYVQMAQHVVNSCCAHCERT